MDEQQMQMAAMDEMLGMGGGAPPEDPFATDGPPGYTQVYVPDAVLPAVMELVSQAEMGGSALGAASQTATDAMMGGVPLGWFVRRRPYVCVVASNPHRVGLGGVTSEEHRRGF